LSKTRAGAARTDHAPADDLRRFVWRLRKGHRFNLSRGAGACLGGAACGAVLCECKARGQDRRLFAEGGIKVRRKSSARGPRVVQLGGIWTRLKARDGWRGRLSSCGLFHYWTEALACSRCASKGNVFNQGRDHSALQGMGFGCRRCLLSELDVFDPGRAAKDADGFQKPREEARKLEETCVIVDW
jgi:hypothetical protein